MQANSQTVRAPRSSLILWKWTGVSAVLHVIVVGALCGVSYLGFAKREAAAKNKQATEEAAAAKAEKEQALKASSAPAPAATPNASATAPTATTPAEKSATTPPEPPAPNTTAPPPSAEKILGIDKTAKPGETPKSPFAGSDDDLLKDLK